MSQLFTRDERLILVDPARGPQLRKVTQWDRLVAICTDPDLVAVVLFSALGALLTVALIHALPGWVEVIASADDGDELMQGQQLHGKIEPQFLPGFENHTNPGNRPKAC